MSEKLIWRPLAWYYRSVWYAFDESGSLIGNVKHVGGLWGATFRSRQHEEFNTRAQAQAWVAGLYGEQMERIRMVVDVNA